MRRLATISILLGLVACSKKESGSSSAGSANAAPQAAPSEPPPPPPKPPEPPAAKSPEEEVADLVVLSVGSKALGSQTIEASCVSVGTVPVGKWTVAAARLKDCGDKTARSLVWLYKRADGGKWNEDYAGQPPKCWKGVPPDIAQAVKALTKIPTC
jgi:hypothetical protein